jgi:hypothetical protein
MYNLCVDGDRLRTIISSIMGRRRGLISAIELSNECVNPAESEQLSRLIAARLPCTEGDECDGWILGENGVENMGAIIGSIAHERSWRIGHVRQQWPDMRGVADFLVGQIKSDDFITVGVDADMTLAPGRAFRSSVFFEQPFARATKLQSRAIGDQMQLACSRTWTALNRQSTSPGTASNDQSQADC